MKRAIEAKSHINGWRYINGAAPAGEIIPEGSLVMTHASCVLQNVLTQAWLNVTAPPDWLYQITYGLDDCRKIRILLENDRYAVVQSPGGRWGDNSGTHYGATTYYMVDKQDLPKYRKSVGLLDAKELQHGGRAKLAQWKKLMEIK